MKWLKIFAQFCQHVILAILFSLSCGLSWGVTVFISLSSSLSTAMEWQSVCWAHTTAFFCVIVQWCWTLSKLKLTEILPSKVGKDFWSGQPSWEIAGGKKDAWRKHELSWSCTYQITVYFTVLIGKIIKVDLENRIFIKVQIFLFSIP